MQIEKSVQGGRTWDVQVSTLFASSLTNFQEFRFNSIEIRNVFYRSLEELEKPVAGGLCAQILILDLY